MGLMQLFWALKGYSMACFQQGHEQNLQKEHYT